MHPSPRSGYQPQFLTTPVPVPQPGKWAVELAAVDGSTVVPYTHFSLSLSMNRRLAVWVAWNIDGKTLLREDQAPGRDKLKFAADPRVKEEWQTLDSVYAKNRLDRGHLARRADLLWGTRTEAEAANKDSFYFTNICPQMDNFNQSGMTGIWGLLENALLDQTALTKRRVTLFGGPVLSSKDPKYRGVQVPLEFWKVFAYEMNGTLLSRVFLLTQSLDGLEPRLRDEFSIYEIPLADLEQRTGLIFPSVLHKAPRPQVLRDTKARLVTSPQDVDWGA